MIDGVKSFGEIRKDTKCVVVEIRRKDVVINTKQSKISGMVFAKVTLVVMKNMEAGKEIVKPIVD